MYYIIDVATKYKGVSKRASVMHDKVRATNFRLRVWKVKLQMKQKR